ncbi:MAG: transposase [Candidatus Accumulibacter sp.]|nr:transposase [Accumulibacter sp.]
MLTTLSQPTAFTIIEIYRWRWQVELAFKRLKSLRQLGHIKKVDKDGARAWLQGKLLVACLIETLILTTKRFSSWKYPQGDCHLPAQVLALA